MMAIKKFDPYKGYRLISYAICWIRAYVQNFIIKDWSLVKMGTTRAQKKIFYKIGKVRKALESDPANQKKYEILANKLNVSKEDIVEMEQRMSTRDLSLDSTFDDDHELTPLDLLQDGRPGQEELVAQKEERRIQEQNVHDAIKRLSEDSFLSSSRFDLAAGMRIQPLTHSFPEIKKVG